MNHVISIILIFLVAPAYGAVYHTPTSKVIAPFGLNIP